MAVDLEVLSNRIEDYHKCNHHQKWGEARM